MKPDEKHITITDNKNKIKEFINEMIIIPRLNAHKWAKTTNQTPNLKIGYPAQHLASLITGMQGTATGARGNDIVDGSEVKSCSKIDQSDKCNDCKNNVLRIEDHCPICGSMNIKRNNDSKWLIPVRSEDELRMLKDETPRFLFIVTDYPEFKIGNYSSIRIRAFEVWVKSERCKNFISLLENYYKYLFLVHKNKNPNNTPAPKNLFPDNYPFFMCNPIKTFECVIKESTSENPDIEIPVYIAPHTDRTNLPSETMPIDLLRKDEMLMLKKRGIDISKFTVIDERTRDFLPLRDSDKTIKIIGHKKHKN
jgi:hypothetical protein